MKLLFDLQKLADQSEAFLEDPIFYRAEALITLGIGILERAQFDPAVSEAFYAKMGRSVAHLLFICVKCEYTDFETTKILTEALNRIIHEFEYTPIVQQA